MKETKNGLFLVSKQGLREGEEEEGEEEEEKGGGGGGGGGESSQGMDSCMDTSLWTLV